MVVHAEEALPLHVSSGRTAYAPPRRHSPLTPFVNTDYTGPPISHGISEESRILGSPTPTQNSAPSSRSDSTSGASNTAPAPANPNSSPHALLAPRPIANPTKAPTRPPSMILYHLAIPTYPADHPSELIPPRFPASGSSKRNSLHSRDSGLSMSSDSKYPSADNIEHGYVPYLYDPLLDDDEEDLVIGKSSPISWRGCINMGALILIIVCILVLFIAGPVIDFTRRDNDFYIQSGKGIDVIGKMNKAGPTTTTEDIVAALPTPDTRI